MTRPAPRKSSLAGSSPITPPAAPAAAQRAPEVEPTAPSSAPRSSSAKKYPKVSFYQDRADTDRVRGAILHTMATEGVRSLSQFIHQAVMAEVERLEAKYNGGQPFPPVAARELPQGRPMGD